MSIHEIEEIKRSVGDVREWLKDQRFTDEDREPDSNINISIDQLNRALALMMIVEKDIERLRELSGDAGKLRKERDEARRERDEARREICIRSAGFIRADRWMKTPKKVAHWSEEDVALSRGWDCFKEMNE